MIVFGRKFIPFR